MAMGSDCYQTSVPDPWHFGMDPDWDPDPWSVPLDYRYVFFLDSAGTGTSVVDPWHLVRIRIRESVPLTNRSGYKFFAYYFLKLHLLHFSKIKSHRSHKTVALNIFAWLQKDQDQDPCQVLMDPDPGGLKEKEEQNDCKCKVKARAGRQKE